MVCVKVSNEFYFFIAQRPDSFPSTPPSSSGASTDEGAVWCSSTREIPREEIGAPWAKNFLNQLCYSVQKTKKKIWFFFFFFAWISMKQLVFAFRNAGTWSCLCNKQLLNCTGDVSNISDVEERLGSFKFITFKQVLFRMRD